MQIDPLIFGAVVLVLVFATAVGPKLFSGPKGPTADDVFVASLPSRYDSPVSAQARTISVPVEPEQHPAPEGAPRAASPARQPAGPPPAPADGLSPLKLPS